MTLFKDRVFKIVSQIPKGKTLSYSQVASLAGSPNASRAVGNIMKGNHNPKVPCHRVIKSNGELGGYNKGVEEKRKKLISEGYRI